MLKKAKKNKEASNEDDATILVNAIPEIIASVIMLVVGFVLLVKFEIYIESWLLQLIPNQMIVTIIGLALSFGPLFYLEEYLEKFISFLLAKMIKKQLVTLKKKIQES